MKIYIKATSTGPQIFKLGYPEFCENFCKSEPCEYLERVPECYVNDGGECRGWDGGYVARIEKGKDVSSFIAGRTIDGDIKYITWWEEGERYYIEVETLNELFELIESVGEKIISYKMTEEPNRDSPNRYGPTFGRPYLTNAQVLEIYDEYRE